MTTTLLFGPLSLLFALAGPPGGERDDQGPPPPPSEAIEACEGLAAGDSCVFPGREGESVSGACFTPEASKPLACRPDHPPPPRS